MQVFKWLATTQHTTGPKTGDQKFRGEATFRRDNDEKARVKSEPKNGSRKNKRGDTTAKCSDCHILQALLPHTRLMCVFKEF